MTSEAPGVGRTSSASAGGTATTGTAPSRWAVRLDAATQLRPRHAGRSARQSVVLLVAVGLAGEPAHRWFAGNAPVTVDPAAIFAPLPTRAPGMSVLRAPTRLPAPTRSAPIRTTSPSTQ